MAAQVQLNILLFNKSREEGLTDKYNFSQGNWEPELAMELEKNTKL